MSERDEDSTAHGAGEWASDSGEPGGDRFGPFAGSHHARCLPPDVPFHIISRVFQGRHLLRPSKTLNSIILGVLGRARSTFPDVKLYAMAFMSNHMHMMLQGPTQQVPAFIAFVKREISRRWGGKPWVNWPGTMWHTYLATALPTPESQENCLAYILSQGVKEGLVARPHDWPGVHAARHLMFGTKLQGEWLDATAFAVARDAERRKAQPKPVREADFYVEYQISLPPIPAWEPLPVELRRARVRKMVTDIQERAAAQRNGRKPAGANRVCRVPLEHRSNLPPQPWFTERRRMICWADRRAPETRDYLDRYWSFQRAFRQASESFRSGHLAAEFPVAAFRPSTYSGLAPPG